MKDEVVKVVKDEHLVRRQGETGEEVARGHNCKGWKKREKKSKKKDIEGGKEFKKERLTKIQIQDQ